MTVCNAYMLKGWLLAEHAPSEIMAAVEAVIQCLTSSPAGNQLEQKSEVVPERKESPTSIPEAAENVPSVNTEQPPAQHPTKKNRNWSPEARAAAAERLRARRAAGLLKKGPPEPGEAEAPRL